MGNYASGHLGQECDHQHYTRTTLLSTPQNIAVLCVFNWHDDWFDLTIPLFKLLSPPSGVQGYSVKLLPVVIQHMFNEVLSFSIFIYHFQDLST